MRILISGSRGFIGTALVPTLEAAGYGVTRLVRGEPGHGELAWDPPAGRLDGRAIDGMDAVIHLAGEGIASHRWSAAHKANVLQSRVEGTSLLASTLARLDHPPKVMLSSSAIGVYGDRGSVPVTEDDSTGSGFLAQVCQAWEAATTPAAARGIRVVLLRTGIVLSPAGGALRKQLPLFRLGLGGRLGTGRQYMSWISLDDAIGAMEWALRSDGLSGPVNLTAPNPATNAEFSATLGRVLHRPAWLAVPRFALAAAMGRQMAAEMLLGGACVLPSRLAEDGYGFLYPHLDDALAALLG